MNPCVPLLALVLVFGLPAAGREAAEPAAAQPSPQEAAVSKVEKLIASARDRMHDYQKEELELGIASLKAQQAASQGVKDLNKAASQIAKGEMTVELRAYRNVMLAAARQWQGFAERFSGLGRILKTLVAERPNVPANLQAEIDSLLLRFDQKNRSLQMKAADLYERVAEYRSALAVCMALYQDIPEDKRAGERALKDKIVGLCEKCGDNATALTIVKGIVDARPEEDRYKDIKLSQRLGGLYEKTGDLKSALDVYKRALDTIPAAKRAGERALKDKIAGLCEKCGDNAAALTIVKGIVDARPENDRYKDLKLSQRLGGLYEKTGDPKNALDVYKRALDTIPADKRAKDGAGLQKKIAAVEKKLGGQPK